MMTRHAFSGLLLLVLLPACDTLTIPLVSGPPLAELPGTELADATVCPDGHGQMANMSFELPEHRGLSVSVMTHEVEGWRTLGPNDTQLQQTRGNPRDEHTPTAPADTQYVSVPIGASLQNTMQVQPGQGYVLLLAHRQGSRALGTIGLRLDGASLPEQPGTGALTMEHQGSLAWEWIRIPFIADAPQVVITIARTVDPTGYVIDHRAHGHFIDIGGIWRICDAPAATAGGESEEAIGGGLGAAVEPTATGTD